LPKVLSSFPLSPQWGERVRVRRDKKEVLATSIIGGKGFPACAVKTEAAATKAAI